MMNSMSRRVRALVTASRSTCFTTPGFPAAPVSPRILIPTSFTSHLKSVSVIVPQPRNFSSDAAPKTPLSKEHFDKLVKNNKIVVFMKGDPEGPRCGFSNAVVQILRMHGVTGYDSHDVLQDEGIRQGIKEYTNWPTIPQVFINGEFVGGCDILIEMHKNGELVEQLSKVGIKSALLEQEGNKDDKK